MGLRAAVLPAAFLAMGWPTFALAHGLVVFAAVEGETVVVEAKFANGQPVRAGEVRVLDAGGREIRRFAIAPDAPISFPLGDAGDGLQIEVSAGDGHENYWILTPRDIAAGRAAGAGE